MFPKIINKSIYMQQMFHKRFLFIRQNLQVTWQ